MTVRAVVLHGHICVLTAGDSIPSQRFGCAHDVLTRTLVVPANQAGVPETISVRLVVFGKGAQSTSRGSSLVETWAAPATVTDGVLDGSLLADALAVSFDGLPPLPDVDATPGDAVDLISNVSEPSPQSTAGVVTFSDNGQTIQGCSDVPVALLNGATTYQAICSYVFSNSGTYTITASYVGSDGSLGTGTHYASIATPDEVAVIDAECAEAATMPFHC